MPAMRQKSDKPPMKKGRTEQCSVWPFRHFNIFHPSSFLNDFEDPDDYILYIPFLLYGRIRVFLI